MGKSRRGSLQSPRSGKWWPCHGSPQNGTNEDLTLRTVADKFGSVIDLWGQASQSEAASDGSPRPSFFVDTHETGQVAHSHLLIGLFHVQRLRDECALTTQAFSVAAQDFIYEARVKSALLCPGGDGYSRLMKLHPRQLWLALRWKGTLAEAVLGRKHE